MDQNPCRHCQVSLLAHYGLTFGSLWAHRRQNEQFGQTLAVTGEQAEGIYNACTELIEKHLRLKAMKAVEMVKDIALAADPQVLQVLLLFHT